MSGKGGGSDRFMVRAPGMRLALSEGSGKEWPLHEYRGRQQACQLVFGGWWARQPMSAEGYTAYGNKTPQPYLS